MGLGARGWWTIGGGEIQGWSGSRGWSGGGV